MNRSTWAHRWFGLWRESGPGFESYPSVLDFVDDSLDTDIRSGIVRYLSTAPVWMNVWSYGRQGSCIFDGQFCFEANNVDPVSRSHDYIRTDGVWGWYPGHTHYVEHHDVVLPDAMTAHIVSRGFTPPSEDATKAPGIKWPSYKHYYEEHSFDALLLGNSYDPTVLNPENVHKRWEECRALAIT